MDDLKIIDLYFERDENAIKETEKKYGRLCLNIATNVIGNIEDAKECVNDTYLGVWNAIPPARPNNFTAFICKIARNISLKKWAFLTCEKRNGDMLVSLSELEDILPDEAINPNISDENIGKFISEFLLSEKENARNIFIRKYYFFDTISDIANRYSFTESKIKSILYRTRTKLREYLIEKGVSI